MKLYSGKIPVIAKEVTHALVRAKAIECEFESEVSADFEAVLKEYLRFERRVTDEAQRALDRQGLSYDQLRRVRGEFAKKRGAPDADDILPYLVGQIIDMLFHSAHVEEVFAEDTALRTLIVPVLRKHLDVEASLDEAIRAKIRNLKEGTPEYEIEYDRISGQVKRSLGLL